MIGKILSYFIPKTEEEVQLTNAMKEIGFDENDFEVFTNEEFCDASIIYSLPEEADVRGYFEQQKRFKSIRDQLKIKIESKPKFDTIDLSHEISGNEEIGFDTFFIINSENPNSYVSTYATYFDFTEEEYNIITRESIKQFEALEVPIAKYKSPKQLGASFLQQYVDMPKEEFYKVLEEEEGLEMTDIDK